MALDNKVLQIFFINFFIWQLLFLIPLFLFKPYYSDAVLAYLALYPFFYLVYILVNAVKETGSDEIRNFVVAQMSLLPIFHAVWLSHVFQSVKWWKDSHSWIGYFGIAAILFLIAVYDFKWAPKVDCDRVADSLAPLAVFHFVYGLATMFSTAVAGVDVYRILLWYFAIYPAALAAALAGGGRLAVLTALAVYLTAYALGAEKLLLLLVAIPVARHLGLHKLLQSL